MSYLLRGALVSFGAFFVVYVALSMAVAGVCRLWRVRAMSSRANALFALRMLPLACALGLVILFVVPSFLRWEPSGSDEAIGFAGIALALGGAAILGAGTVSASVAWLSARRFLRAQTGRATSQFGTTMLEIAGEGPMLLVAGVCRPRLFVSEQASSLLSESEMRAALQHELAHVRFHDNFKKLALRFCRFPMMAGLEQRWSQAAELAADDAAAVDESTALELASALIKVARRAPASCPAIAMSLLPEHGEALRFRVERLLAWQPLSRRTAGWRSAAQLAAAGAAVLVVSYGPALSLAHQLTELLVR